MVNGDVATAVNGTTADNDTAVKPAVPRASTPDVTRDAALDMTREATWDLPGTKGGPADLTDESPSPESPSPESPSPESPSPESPSPELPAAGRPAAGRSGRTTPADPVAAELVRLRRSLDHAVDLYEGYRESAAERALRITELLSDLDERESKLADLRSEVQQRTRAHEEQLATALRRYQNLRQRRGVRLALRLASAVKRVRAASARFPRR